MTTWTIEGQNFTLIECCKCSMRWLQPTTFNDNCRNEGARAEFFCPAGHGQVYKTSRLETLRLERDRLKQQIAQKDDEVASARARAASAEAATMRLRKRVGAGVCPCCNRSFANLARHMKTKHDGKVVSIKRDTA